MNEFNEMDESFQEVKKLLNQLKAKYLEEERKAKSEAFWKSLMEKPLTFNQAMWEMNDFDEMI